MYWYNERKMTDQYAEEKRWVFNFVIREWRRMPDREEESSKSQVWCFEGSLPLSPSAHPSRLNIMVRLHIYIYIYIYIYICAWSLKAYVCCFWECVCFWLETLIELIQMHSANCARAQGLYIYIHITAAQWLVLLLMWPMLMIILHPCNTHTMHPRSHRCPYHPPHPHTQAKAEACEHKVRNTIPGQNPVTVLANGAPEERLERDRPR